MVGTLRAELVAELERRYGARELGGVDSAAAADAEVAVTSGVWGVRAEHLDRLPDAAGRGELRGRPRRHRRDRGGRRGVLVANTPDVLTDCVADTAVGLVIDVMRGLSAADRFVRRGEWASGRVPALTRRVTGARVGILGLGRIGLAVAHRLTAFDTTIGYHNRRERTDVPYRVRREPARARAAFRRAGRGRGWRRRLPGLVDAEVLDALGPDGFLVNVARGSVVDEAALRRRLGAGAASPAPALDVFADEPQVPEALLGRDDVVLLPHVGSATVETRAEMSDLVLANVEPSLPTGRW